MLMGSPSMWSTTSTMCSNTRGPAISPPLVTWPLSIMAVSPALVHSISLRVHPLICARLPASELTLSSHTVCIESTTASAGRCWSRASSTSSSPVAGRRYRSSPDIPRRSARIFTWTADSSPET